VDYEVNWANGKLAIRNPRNARIFSPLKPFGEEGLWIGEVSGNSPATTLNKHAEKPPSILEYWMPWNYRDAPAGSSTSSHRSTLSAAFPEKNTPNPRFFRLTESAPSASSGKAVCSNGMNKIR